MLIYHRQVSLAEGFAVLSEHDKEARLVAGKRVSLPSGAQLFKHLHSTGQRLVCWKCGIEASCFIANKGQNDTMGPPVLDLFATDEVGNPILMTRDHIIPKSYGGKNDVANLRVGCGPWNQGRGTAIDPEDIAFMRAHPELIGPNPKLTLGDDVTSVDKVSPVKERLTPEEKLAKKEKLRAKRRAARHRKAAKKAEQKANKLPHLTTMLALALA